MQIGDERAHESRLADASGERKANGWKLAFKIRDRGILGVDDCKRGSHVRRFARRDDFRKAVQDYQRFVLRRTQTETTCNGVDVLVHCLSSGSPNKSCCPAFGGALGRFSIFKL